MYLKSHPNDINQHRFDRTPLQDAVKAGKDTTVMLLLKNKADVNMFANSDEAPVFLAVDHIVFSHSNRTILSMIILAGANLDITNSKGQTLLHLSIEKVRKRLQSC